MPGDSPQLAAFAAAAGLTAPSPAIARALEAAAVGAAGARAGIVAEPVDFAAALGVSVGAQPDDAAVVDAIAGVHLGDLWLACACASGQRAALDELDALLSSLRPTIARVGADAGTIDELLQQHRARLLVHERERPPRILAFRGHGDLRSWLKVALVREALRAQHRAGTSDGGGDDELARLMAPGPDPEHAAMLESYRAGFREAFARALARLAPRDRNVLRYHLLEELAIDDIGAIYRVHRATAARWLVRIREQLHDDTRSELRTALAIAEHELDSVLRLLRSQLDASIARGLAPSLG